MKARRNEGRRGRADDPQAVGHQAPRAGDQRPREIARLRGRSIRGAVCRIGLPALPVGAARRLVAAGHRAGILSKVVRTMSATLALTEQLIARASVTPDDQHCQQIMTERLAALLRDHRVARRDQPVGRQARHRRPRRQAARVRGPHRRRADRPARAVGSPPFIPPIATASCTAARARHASLAAFVVASEEFVAAHPGHRGAIAFLITSDEEGPPPTAP